MDSAIVDDYFTTLKTALDKIDRRELVAVADVIREAGDRQASIWVIGNGGSAAMASHMACDLGKGASFGYQRRYNAIALSDNIATLTAYANDVSYEVAFVEQLKNSLRAGDLVIALSGSGNSPNILRAIEYANEQGAITIGITGYVNGKLKHLAKYNLNLNIDHMQIAEDLHLILNHNLVNLLTHGAPKAH